MFESRGLPDYPPPRNAWTFPPPPISRRWKWVAILAGVGGLVAGSALLAATIVLGTSGAPGIIDDEDLIRVIERECRGMTRAVESTPLVGPLPERARAIQKQNRAVNKMVSAIERGRATMIRDDRPSAQWLADWRAIVDARNRYVLDLVKNGAAVFEMPLAPDGAPVVERMQDVWLGSSSCDVPDVLVNPYPDDSSDV